MHDECLVEFYYRRGFLRRPAFFLPSSRFLTVLLWRRACFPTVIDSGSPTSSMTVEISPTALGGQLVSVVAHGDV